MSIMFNENCINEEMLPIYIYIYIYRERERFYGYISNPFRQFARVSKSFKFQSDLS